MTEVPDLETVLIARATEVVRRYPLTPKMRIVNLDKGEFVALTRSIEAMFSESFEHFVELGLEG